MKIVRRNKLMKRWALLSMAIVGLFWGVWYLIHGSFPVVESIKMTENWTLQLPLEIPRWTDILFVPILVLGVIWIVNFVYEKISEGYKKNFDVTGGARMVTVIVAGIFACIIVGIYIGGVIGAVIGIGIAAGIVAGIFASIAAGIGEGIGAGIGVGIGMVIGMVIGAVVMDASIGVSIGVSIGAVIGASIAAGIFATTCAVIGAGIGLLLVKLFNMSFWKNVGKWLIVKD